MEQQQQHLQQHLQLQQLQQQQQQYFVPVSSERLAGPNNGIVVRHNKTAMKATAVLGVATSSSNTASTTPPASNPVSTTPPATTVAAATPPATTVAAATEANPLVGMVQDVVLGMILNIPAMRTKLQSILDNPSLITAEIKKAHDELNTKLSPVELRQLNSYACQDSSRRTIGGVMQTAFANIMADGKIDMNDAPHFLTLIHECITLFSTDAVSANTVALNSNTVINFLHFVIKCILILTLDGPEEDSALVMLDCSFKLVKLTVMPLIAGKKWCCFK
jgi:hypothetical protein